MKKKKYSFGGQLFAAAAQFIPGIGQIVSPLISMADQYGESQTEQFLQKKNNLNKNISGKTFANGGPILPNIQSFIDSTGLPIRFDSNLGQPTHLSNVFNVTDLDTSKSFKVFRNEDGSYRQFQDVGGFSLTSHSKSKPRFREKALGGFIADGFKQYNTGSHASGNDLGVDANGNPSTQSAAVVQNKENTFNVNGKPYVMSDTLINPKSGNTFNIDAAKLSNKLGEKARFNLDVRNTLNLQMSNLALKNEQSRLKAESKQSIKKALGGPIGGPVIQPATINVKQDDLNKLLWKPIDYTFPTIDNNITNISGEPNNFAIDTTNPVVSNAGEQPTPVAKPKMNMLSGLALGAKALSLSQLVRDAAEPSQRESLVQPNYNVANQYIRGANVDYSQAKQDAIAQSNVLGNANRAMSSSANQFLGRESMRIAQLQDTQSRINESQNNAQSQLRLGVGQLETQKAMDLANRRYQNRIDNLQNQANTRFADRVLSSNLSSIGTELSNISAQQAEMQNRKDIAALDTQQAIQYLNAKYPGISIDPSKVEKFRNGEITLDELLKVTI